MKVVFFVSLILIVTNSVAADYREAIDSVTWDKTDEKFWEEYKEGEVVIALPRNGKEHIYIYQGRGKGGSELLWESRKEFKRDFNLNGYKWDILTKNQYYDLSEKMKSRIFGKIASYKSFDSLTLGLEDFSIRVRCYGCKASELFDSNGLFDFSHEKLNVYEFNENMWYGKIVPVRKANKYDSIIHRSDLSSSDKLLELIAVLAEDRLMVTMPSIEKPKKPKILEPTDLVKGEFEKTSEFNDRLATESQRIKEINNANDIEYRKQIAEYDQKINLALHYYNENKTHNKKPSTIKAALNDVAPLAATMVFGNPRFENIKYDADNEVFSVTLISTINNFSMNVEIPVPISKAKEFKSKILDTRLIPSVIFEVKNGELKFNNIMVVTNTIKQEQDYNNAKLAHTVRAYEDFIKTHGDAPQTKLAKNEISKIKEEKIKELTRREIEAKDRAAKAEARKERERKAYLREKNIGDRVCKDGRVAFGLIGVTISAYVERVNGNDVQLRVNSTEGQSIYYNGGKLFQGKMLWDKHYEWKNCD